MQTGEFDEFDPSELEPSRFSRIRSAISTAIGALVAMALLLTLGVWFYRLGVRDAQNVPIIRAAIEPAKTRPDDPGGLVAPHQDVSSYGVADSAGVQASAAVIAPPPPEPRAEDVAMGELTPVSDAPVAPQKPAATVANALSGAVDDALKDVSTEDLIKQAEEIAAVVRAVQQPDASTAPEETAAKPAEAAPQQPEEAAQVQEPEPTDEPAADATGEQLALATPATSEDTAEAEANEEEPAPEITGGSREAPAISPPVLKRPPNLLDRVKQAGAVEKASASELSARAAQSAVQIQLAADPSEAVIRAMWAKIRRANDDILHDRALAVGTTISGGTTYYRLRVGPFRDGAEARSVCQALKARGQDCLVARKS
ncbi:MAG: SPOR domain-containing protein [Pseudomonadota bacterium]